MPTIDRLSAGQVADLLGVDIRTVHRMVADGRLSPLFKLPGLRGAYVFTRREVERVLTERGEQS